MCRDPALQESGRRQANSHGQVASVLSDTGALKQSFPFDETPELERNMLPRVTRETNIQTRSLQACFIPMSTVSSLLAVLPGVGRQDIHTRKGT